MATHSSILAWRIPLIEKPAELQSVGLQRVRHNRVTHTHTHTCSLELDMFLLRNTKLNLHYIQDFQTWETPPEFCKIRIFKVGPGSKLLKLPMWFSGSVRFRIYWINKCWQGSQGRCPLSRPQDVCTEETEQSDTESWIHGDPRALYQLPSSPVISFTDGDSRSCQNVDLAQKVYTLECPACPEKLNSEKRCYN